MPLIPFIIDRLPRQTAIAQSGRLSRKELLCARNYSEIACKVVFWTRLGFQMLRSQGNDLNIRILMSVRIYDTAGVLIA